MFSSCVNVTFYYILQIKSYLQNRKKLYPFEETAQYINILPFLLIHIAYTVQMIQKIILFLEGIRNNTLINICLSNALINPSFIWKMN